MPNYKTKQRLPVDLLHIYLKAQSLVLETSNDFRQYVSSELFVNQIYPGRQLLTHFPDIKEVILQFTSAL